ncbi:MAG: hypothetical protein EKK40_05360 [Bradyrhizobiaceae bacterium]|nr:MAG: hypothetical protein EKK40_05360 [Bradyrhizobiaceae bacterium]
MIVFITTRGHGYSLKSIQNGTFGFPAPSLKIMSYERLLGARRIPRATYIFSDIERLPPFLLGVAAELYRAMRGEGLRCLNDPAKVKSRLALLRTLHRSGINPFNAYRADESPRPARFPVFVRFETDHGSPLTGLIHSQAELETALSDLENSGTPLRGAIVTEYCSSSDADGLFHKWGTFRIGDQYSVDHIAVEKNWLVKYGKWDDITEPVAREEHETVSQNRFSPDLSRAFELAHIEFGRADYAIVDGRIAIYEINTNPYIGPFVPDSKPLRLQTQTIARTRMGKALEAIDTEDGGTVRLSADPSPLLKKCRRWRLGWQLPKHP